MGQHQSKNNKLLQNNSPIEVPDIPGRYLLDLTTRCNLRCPMCLLWGRSGNKKFQELVKGEMPEKKFIQIINEIKDIKPLIQPNMYGEPLVAPLVKDQIAIMKQNDCTVAINTNGLLMTKDLANHFVKRRLDSISFSIDAVYPKTYKKVRGVNKLTKVESSVFMMQEARNDNSLPRIGVSFTKQKENQEEMDEFINKWIDYVDYVRIGLKFEEDSFVDMPTQKIRKPCPSLYNTMAIHNDGVVSICCLDAFKTTNMGNVFKDGIQKVWQSEAFTEIRYLHETMQWDKIPICKNCNGWAQYEFKETVENNILIRESPQLTYYNRIDKLVNWDGSLLGGHKKPDI